jgi:hypothetical protein
MSRAYDFERLLETAGLIVRHADFPGKPQMLERCRAEVDDLSRSGRISLAQHESVRDLLSGAARQRTT